MKVIPEKPIPKAVIDKVIGGNKTPALAAYTTFLRKYGGGHIFPNSVRLDEPLMLEAPFHVISVQYFVNPIEHDEGPVVKAMIERDFSERFLDIAVVLGGDHLLLSLDPQDTGAIWFWSSYGNDGIHGTKRRIADSFADLLSAFDYYEEEGKTPPWNRMSSINEAPAIDLEL